MSLLLVAAPIGQGVETDPTLDPTPTLPEARAGQTAYLVGGGDSISMNYPSETLTGTYQRYAADVIGKSYAAAGHSGYRVDQILATYASDVIAKKGNYVIPEGGVNDVVQGRANNLIIADCKAMVDMAVADGSIVVYVGIIPWTNGTNTQMQSVDAINGAMRAYMAANYPEHIVLRAEDTMGQYRAGGDSGNKWDLIPAYTSDGVHLTSAGNQALGEAIGQAILDSL